jgi:hypothetical protein
VERLLQLPEHNIDTKTVAFREAVPGGHTEVASCLIAAGANPRSMLQQAVMENNMGM